MCLVLAVVLLAVGAKQALHYWNFAPMAFEHGRWVQAGEREDWCVRTKMAKYLVSHKELLSQERTRILQVLGEPEHYTDVPERQLDYLVREDWDWIDPSRVDHLVISFDQNDRAVEARIDVLKIRE